MLDTVDAETVTEPRARGQSPDSDAQLAQRVAAALQSAGYATVRKIEIDVREGHVRLEGCVPTYFMKQLAQAKALAVQGVQSVQNNLVVAPRATDAEESAAP
jgi:osmotically-inducible protein OsmY